MEQDAASPQAKSVNDWLREGVTAAKSGQRERARELLMYVVEQDERNASAWLWLSGVVDSLEDREICLENVLTLDPDNDAARKGLDWVRKQKETQAPPPAEAGVPPASAPESPMAVRARTSVSPAAAILHDGFARHRPPPEPGSKLPPSTTWDEFDDETLCSYCATQTHPEDRRCKACGGDLWIRSRRREERSSLFWTLLAFQFFNTFLLGIAPLPVLIYVGLRIGAIDPLALLDISDSLSLLDIYLRFSTFLEAVNAILEVVSAALAVVPRFALPLSALPFVFSLATFIGLCLRWRPAYYLLLADALLGLVAAAVLMVLFQDIVFGAIGLALTLLRLLLTFRVEDDFQWEKRRIVLRLDRGLASGVDFMARGDLYAKRKMWAMAVIHLRRAAGLLPDQLDCRLALAVAYIRLNRYDRAAQTLEGARRISPHNPRIKELGGLLDELRSAGNSL